VEMMVDLSLKVMIREIDDKDDDKVLILYEREVDEKVRLLI
jgi:hypothetical protein